MLETPTHYTLVAGRAEGATPLNAFDNALLAAHVGNVNLLHVSSILPPGSQYVERLILPPGSLVPIAYASILDDHPGALITAGVAVGLSKDAFGVIMEFSGHCDEETARQQLRAMVQEAFTVRKMLLADIRLITITHRVEKQGCAFAAVPLWYAPVEEGGSVQ